MGVADSAGPCPTNGGIPMNEAKNTNQSAPASDPDTGGRWDRVDACASYADGLHTLCLSMARNHDAAAEALYATFAIADQYAGQYISARPGESSSLRARLYAIARAECLRLLRGQRPRALRGLAKPSVEWPAGHEADEAVADLELTLRQAELQSLAWPEAHGLEPRQREVLELSIRHGLSRDEIAVVLGTSAETADGLLRQARDELRRSLTALTVAQRNDYSCDQLTALVGPNWNGRLTSALRSGLLRHIDRCPECRTQRDTVEVPELPSLLPLVPAPRALRQRIIDEPGSISRSSQDAESAVRAGVFAASGSPITFSRNRWKLHPQQIAVAAVSVSLLAGAAAFASDQIAGDLPATGDTAQTVAQMVNLNNGHPPEKSPIPQGKLVLVTEGLRMRCGTTRTVTIENSGPGSLEWTASTPQTFLKLNKKSGTLRSGQKAMIRITAQSSFAGQNPAPPGEWDAYVMFSAGSDTEKLSIDGWSMRQSQRA